MAQFQWTQPVAAPARQAAPEWVQRLVSRYFDWEDGITLVLLLGATVSVAATLESGGWSTQMPALTLVSVLAAVSALVLCRSGSCDLFGRRHGDRPVIVFWQTLVMVGPGRLASAGQPLFGSTLALAAFMQGQQRFPAFHAGPGIVAAYLLWSVFHWRNAGSGSSRWHRPLHRLAFVGDSLSRPAAVLPFGFLLIMR
jgi:hypothetical protein